MKFRGITALLLVCALAAFTRIAAASPQLTPACPFDFFTNVASRLLSSQLNANLNHIQIYPTNQYTPAVHRLLQVTANILDATTTNYYPSVFRPLFWKTNEECGGVWQTNIYIAGYQYVQEPLASNNPPILNTPMDVSDTNMPFGLSGITNNIYGIPWILGVKKGLPNFNALELDNCFFIERQLQFIRSDNIPGSTTRTYTTNQMYIIGVSNIFAMEDWNSYAEAYTTPITIVAQQRFSFGLSNDAPGFVQVTNTILMSNFNSPLETNDWPGDAFILPLGTNGILQNLAPPQTVASANNLYAYFDGSAFPSTNIDGVTYTAPCFVPASPSVQTSMNVGTPSLPHLVMISTNWLRAYIMDANNCILDYVQLGGIINSLDVNAAIADPNSNLAGGEFGGLWSTNIFAANTPFGVIEQYLVSFGSPFPVVDGDEISGTGIGSQIGWSTAPVPGIGTAAPAAQIAYFQAFFSPNDEAPFSQGSGYITNLDLTIFAPFTPARLVVQRAIYAANDPLVHYLASDLNDFPDNTNGHYSLKLPAPKITYIGYISDRYMPWGLEGNLARITQNGVPADNNPYNFAYKDPLVTNSDGWNFPTNQALNASWLGQVHRGTPWQTVYLKSPNILGLTVVAGSQQILIGPVTWALWTGDLNFADAASMAPMQDWQMAALLASMFNTNNESSLFSANDPNPNDWENLLSGMTALTNDVPDFVLGFNPMPQFATLTISSNSTQAAEIANAVESARTSSPGQLFTTPGNIFAVPQLSVQSPFLNWNDSAQERAGISDLAYEAIPDQLLPLLRVDSIGSMSTANGQVVIQFTGDDNHAYAVQSSPNLVNWTTMSTNCPMNGIFTLTNNAAASAQFYRTILLY
ncbi:MAG TPA: hypothetical protein VGY56_06600 [Verrucomicrobiae bacterium]|nr:hypothetical protein [Verrucomicrobiae bacterium]